MKILLRILPFYKRYRPLLIGGYIAVIGNAVFNLAVPSLIGVAVDEGVVKQDASRLVFLSIMIVIASALRIPQA